jgi:hypothetical protein
MTNAVDIYEVLSERIERDLAPRKTLAQPELAFRRIGIAAVAGALAATRPDIAKQPSGPAPARDRVTASTWR